MDEGEHTGEVGAIILAGGRGKRLGGVDKPLLDVGGVTMRARVVGAAREALGPDAPIVVVGTPAPDLAPFGEVRVVREEPPFAGPVAALARGARELGSATHVLVLGGDMPRLSAEVLAVMVEHSRGIHARQVSLARDEEGRAQFLCALWPTAVLRDALARLSEEKNGLEGASVRRLYGVASGRLHEIALHHAAAVALRDVDDPRALAAVRAAFQS